MLDPSYPKIFHPKTYTEWHKSHFKEKDLPVQIDLLREHLKKRADKPLHALSKILARIIKDCKRKFHRDEFHSPLLDRRAFSESRYDEYFKKPTSVLNKIWRRNYHQHVVSLKTLETHITDLVRTEISCSSLQAGRNIKKYFTKDSLNNYLKAQNIKLKVKEAHVDSEMKMSSGYFAYHVSLTFSNDVCIEIQIHSRLMDSWRKLSHRLYEITRMQPAEQHYDFNSTESRLISLGHLLHLAECELSRLEIELLKPSNYRSG